MLIGQMQAFESHYKRHAGSTKCKQILVSIGGFAVSLRSMADTEATGDTGAMCPRDAACKVLKKSIGRYRGLSRYASGPKQLYNYTVTPWNEPLR